jgi:endonuclease III related protein
MPPTLIEIYRRLEQHFGRLCGEQPAWTWWPIFSRAPLFEMMVGAVLVQQTRWETVEDALLRLDSAGLLHPPAMAGTDPTHLALLIRPAAFHSQKAPGLIRIAEHLCAHYGGNPAHLLARPTEALRAELLALPRIGPETADVIMLYAGGHAVFVIDDYTRRLFERVLPTPPIDWRRARYALLRSHIEQALAGQVPPAQQAALYAEFHAQINEICVRYCLSKPRCDGPPARRVYSRQPQRDSYLDRHDGCPLRTVCAYYQQRAVAIAE